jgi:phosphate transport system substrate-binding protein
MRLTPLAAAAALIALATLPAAPAAAQTAGITGAGATFPAPVYFRWGEAARSAIGVQLNFQPIGSGGGINQITNRTVDFGATDAPLGEEQLAASNLVQFPTVVGGIVMVINVPGVADRQMRLTGELIADIFLGRISRWNDARLVELNPGITLPNIAIAPVFRADASGTTYQFTNYLSQLSSDWAQRVGNRTSVRWPAGVGARGNDGVAGSVRNTRGAIGYVEYVFAKSNDLPVTLLRNREGRFVDPSNEALQAAAANADWAGEPGFGISLNNQPGEASWPMTAPTFILVPTDARQPERTANVLRFFDWAFRDGGQMALDLTYIPMPGPVVELVRATWKERLGFTGN